MGEVSTFLLLPKRLEDRFISTLRLRESENTILPADTPQSLRKNSQFKKVSRLVDELVALGFAREAVAPLLAKSTGASVHQAVDWLCLHLSDEQLPNGFVQRRTEYEVNPPPNRYLKQQIYDDFEDYVTGDLDAALSYEMDIHDVTDELEDMGFENQDESQSFKFQPAPPSYSQKKEPPRVQSFASSPSVEKKKPEKLASKEPEPKKQEVKGKDTKTTKPGAKPLDVEPEKGKKGGKKSEAIPEPDPKKKGGKETKVSTDGKPSKDAPTKTAEALPEKKEPPRIVWTGKLPKTYLHEWCQKNKVSKPRFEEMRCKGGQFKFQIIIEDKKKGNMTFKVDQAFPTVQEAQHAVSTRALYELTEGQPLYRLFPSPFKDMWVSWDSEKKKSAEEMKKASESQRRDFINQFIPSSSPSLSGESSKSQTSKPPGASSPVVMKQEAQVTIKTIEKPTYVAQETHSFRFTPSDSPRLKKLTEAAYQSPGYQQMLTGRKMLPSYQFRDKIIEAINQKQVVVISGDTGCGKTTQIPQFILEHMIDTGKGGECNIICTQPRRISAVSVAQRVADERVEKLGSPGSLVGYQVRMESRRSADTRLLYCTTGILLRMLQGNSDLNGVSHIIVDEVHERSVESDLLLLMLLLLLKKGSNIKVVLMSATVNSRLFANYFNSFQQTSLKIPGRTFPVKEHFLEDIIELTSFSPASYEQDMEFQFNSSTFGPVPLSENQLAYDSLKGYKQTTIQALKDMDESSISYDLIESTLRYIHSSKPEGAILVFLPGLLEIQTLYDRLLRSDFGGQLWIKPLHSQLSTADQQSVFDKPPATMRKVVISTNICETSVTIEDICYVVDTGKVRQSGYSTSSRMQVLQETWAAKSNVKQRAGRAGRVRSGECYFLFSKLQHELLLDFPVPEMRRSSLDELILLIKSTGIAGSIRSILSQALEPPDASAIESSVKNLIEAGAISIDDEDNELLTALGSHLSRIPVDVHIGKMIVYGAIFECIEPILHIAATLSLKSPFQVPFNRKEEALRKHELFAVGHSDLLTMWNVVRRYQDEKVWPFIEQTHVICICVYFSIDDATISYCRSHERIFPPLDKWFVLILGQRSTRHFCEENYLNQLVLEQICELAKDFGDILSSVGLLPRGRGGRADIDACNKNSENHTILKSIICAGLYPNIGSVSKQVDGTPIYGGNQEAFNLHPSSVNYGVREIPSNWIAYHTKVKQRKITLRDSTFIPPMAIPLFASSLDVQYSNQVIVVDNWMRLGAPVRNAAIIRQMRRQMDLILREKTENPSQPLSPASQETLGLIGEALQI